MNSADSRHERAAKIAAGLKRPAYQQSIQEIFHDYSTGLQGIDAHKASHLLTVYGRNEIASASRAQPLKIFFNQFSSPLIWILVAAIFISLFLGDPVETIIIVGIICIMTSMGFMQEYKAEKAIDALRRIQPFRARVLRSGVQAEISAKELVPGDLILLETGDKVPADCRIINALELRCQEAALTGESNPVEKSATYFTGARALAERANMAFMGTIVVNGKARAIVTATGMHTEMGHIAHLVEEAVPEITPLQKNLNQLGRWITIAVLLISAMIFGIGLLSADTLGLKTPIDALLIAISLAVAAVPEGLPAIVTLTLAIGIRRMVKKNVLIRKLHSVETLGSTTVICTDKTGTLTMNEMTVKKIFVDDQIIDVSGAGYEPSGRFSVMTKTLPLLLRIGALNNDAALVQRPEGWNIVGDPTEGALIASAAKLGFKKTALEHDNERVDEIAFSSERKLMTTVNMIDDKKFALVKGAPDLLLERCDMAEISGKKHMLTPEERRRIIKINDAFSSDALRVLGFAYKELKTGSSKENYEQDLIFVGLQGMIDPPREEAKHAIKTCEKAGIRVIMITGDSKTTAEAIARQLGLNGKTVTAQEMETLSLEDEIDNIQVYARVNPEHKLRIIEALKRKGHIVAMTGDGVNDAPALKKADIGIAMGRSGTDVAKEASDMILMNDNFANIVEAVEEGRIIYNNIRKFVNYLLSSNIGEVLLITIAILLGMPLPLLAVQILWLNFVTDGLPALAFGIDPGAKDIMHKPPRNPRMKIINKSMILQIITIGLLIAAAGLTSFRKGMAIDYSTAVTMTFCTLVFIEIARIIMIRMIYRVPLFSNRWLWGAFGSAILLQSAVIYTPLSRFFETVPLSIAQLGSVLMISGITFVIGIALTFGIERFAKEETL